MELRNLRRAFLFNRAISRTSLSIPEFNILYGLSFGPIKALDLAIFLKRNRRTALNGSLHPTLYKLMDRGLVEKDGPLFSLSSSGYAALYELESICRSLRPDK